MHEDDVYLVSIVGRVDDREAKWSRLGDLVLRRQLPTGSRRCPGQGELERGIGIDSRSLRGTEVGRRTGG